MKQFDHEKLEVYQRGLEFVGYLSPILRKLKKYDWNSGDQLNRASQSILLNIAEGNGRQGKNDKARFFAISKGSALECSAILDIAHKKEILTKAQIDNGKKLLYGIVSMLFGLIRRFKHNS